jgi:hypothetical protein
MCLLAAACWAPQSRSVDISCRAGKEQRVMHAPPCVHVLVWGRRGNYIGGRVRLQRSKEHHGRAIGTREKRSAEKEEGGRRSPRYKEWKIAVRGICVSGSSRRGKFKECTTLRGAFECTSVECFRRGWRRRCFRLLRPGVGPLTPRESDTGGAHHVNQGRYSHARVPGNRARSW